MSLNDRNVYLDHGPSDESDNDAGYDSEAAEVSKTTRSSKRRKIDHSSPIIEDEVQRQTSVSPSPSHDLPEESGDEDTHTTHHQNTPSEVGGSKKASKQKSKTKKVLTPGVIYLSSLPPYLKPAALRNLLEQRGFSPIKRLFLTPASKHKSSSKKNSRQLYTEGWIEFTSKKTARRCAESLNTQQVGGKKGGFYHDDVWNMKYLRGMRWEELMAGIREEKREEEGRRDEDRRVIARETKMFVEGVEEGRRREGMKRKREMKGATKDSDADANIQRTWRQAEVKGRDKSDQVKEKGISDDVRQVLGKIF
ncbi:RNA-binding ATPase activator esf2 [Exophiala oligosperma]